MPATDLRVTFTKLLNELMENIIVKECGSVERFVSKGVHCVKGCSTQAKAKNWSIPAH